MLFHKKKLIITHSGQFHADDVFAVAALQILFGEKNIKITRTRDEKVIVRGDIVIDVGGIYDESKARFDHHQTEGAGKRENGIPYSSLGLIWKRYGKDICGSEKVANHLDASLVQPIDAGDNGMEIYKPINDVMPYTVSGIVHAFNPAWDEKWDVNEGFFEVLEFTKKILKREIKRAQSKFKGEEIATQIYKNTEDKRIIILDKDYPVAGLMVQFPEPLFVVYPKSGTWHTVAVRQNLFDFKIRKPFPASWAGKRDGELVKLTGVSDAIFCHRNLFLSVAKSKNGAVELARKALSNN
ncbi:MAG: MYG1 family protein [Patescibacteria group bacterium]